MQLKQSYGKNKPSKYILNQQKDITRAYDFIHL